MDQARLQHPHTHRLRALEGKRDRRQSGQPRRHRLLQARSQSRQDQGTLGREPVAGYTRLQEQVRGMGGEDEEARVGGYGSVRFAYDRTLLILRTWPLLGCLWGWV